MRLWSLFLIVALLWAAAIGLLHWRQTSFDAARRADEFERQRRIEAAHAALDRPIELTDRWLALYELPEAIHRATGLEVELDAKGLEAEGVKPQTPLTWVRGRFSARSALEMLLVPLGLGYDVEERRVVIAGLNSLRDQNELRAVVYPLPQPDFAAGAVTSDDWQEMVTTIVQPESWDDVGGGAHCEAVPGGLVIVQTEHAHRQIRQLLMTLGSLRSPPESYASVPIAPFLKSPSEQRIMAALAEPTQIVVAHMPLSQLIDQLARRHGIPMLLHSQKLHEAGVSTDTLVTVSLTDISLTAALRRMLDEFELTYVVEHEALIVTTPEDAESPDKMLLVAHPVHDLIDWPVDPAPLGDYDPLIDLITTSVAPESWVDVGGPGSIEALDGWLLLSQTHEVHAQIESLLANLRRALAYQSHPLALGIAEESPRAKQLQAALAREIHFSFIDEPLNKAVAKLAHQLGLPIVLAARELEEAGVRTDAPVTCNLASAPLETRLRLLLDPLGLTHAVRDEVLLITTPEDAESPHNMLIRVYDVRPMLDRDLGIADPDSLIDSLTTLITPEAWSDVGGPASIKEFRGLLVICHTHDGHRDTERLIAALEEHCLDMGRGRMLEPWVVDIRGAAGDARLEKVLCEAVDVDICGEPLEWALCRLADKLGVQLVFDRPALDSVRYWPTRIVTHSSRGETLARTLQQLLEPSSASFVVRDGVLLITSTDRRDYALELFPLRMYRLTDLLRGGTQTLEQVAEKLVAGVGPDVASNIQDGICAIKEFPSDWLAVSADRVTHERIADYLTELRTGKTPRRELERRAWAIELERLQLDLEPPIHAVDIDERGNAIPVDSDPFWVPNNAARLLSEPEQQP
ncbi:MAG: hypothetical protein L0211_11850 [Planctomycetaceae bacterium]|nr:hypothetical protein [Planctomycetaceae bacterium]